MVEQLHHLHLPVHLGEVGGVQLGLVYDLDGDLKFANVREVLCQYFLLLNCIVVLTELDIVFRYVGNVGPKLPFKDF